MGTKICNSLVCTGPAHRLESLARLGEAAKVATVICGEAWRMGQGVWDKWLVD